MVEGVEVVGHGDRRRGPVHVEGVLADLGREHEPRPARADRARHRPVEEELGRDLARPVGGRLAALGAAASRAAGAAARGLLFTAVFAWVLTPVFVWVFVTDFFVFFICRLR